MKKYALTSLKFTGQIMFGYNDSRALVYYHNESDMPFDGHSWMLRNLPLGEDEITPLSKKLIGTLSEIPADLSFEKFWEDYGKKINKKRTEPLFERLNDGEKMLAVMRVAPYKSYCARTKFRGIADPEKYLRDRYFETDWSKEK